METKLLSKDFRTEILAGLNMSKFGARYSMEWSEKHWRKRNANFFRKFRGT